MTSSLSLLVAASSVCLSGVLAADAPCLELSNGVDAAAYARTLQLASLQAGSVGAVCFEGGRLTLNAIADISKLLTANGGASLSGKFTASDATVTNLACTLPTESVAEVLKSVNGGAVSVANFKFSCVDAATQKAFLSWDGVALKRGSSGVVVVDPKPTSAPVDMKPPVDPKPVDGECVGIQAVLRNPTLILNGACLKVAPFAGLFKTPKLDLAAIARDIQAGKPLTISGSYERPDGTTSVKCTVDQKTVALLLPLLLQGAGAAVDINAAKNNLAITCKTDDGKRQFGIDGNDIRGVDVDGSTVKFGDRTLDLGKLVPDVVNGNTVQLNGFKLNGNQLTLPDGRVITLTAEDVVKFLARTVVINGAGRTTLASDKGQVDVVNGKVSFTDSNGMTKTVIADDKRCTAAAPAATGDKLVVTCSNGRFSVDAEGNSLPEAPVLESSTVVATQHSGAASLLLAATASLVAALAVTLF